MRRIGIGLAAAVLIMSSVTPVFATKPNASSDLDGGHRVTICHATSSSNPKNYWIEITVDIASSGGLNKFMGHLEHANDPNKKDGRGDAIPPFFYPGYPPFEGIGLGQTDLPIACGGGIGELTVIKRFVNTEGGDDPTGFRFTVNGSTYAFDASGTNVVAVPTGGTYTVVEEDAGSAWLDPVYQDCTGITLPQVDPCIITNEPGNGG